MDRDSRISDESLIIQYTNGSSILERNLGSFKHRLFCTEEDKSRNAFTVESIENRVKKNI